MLGLEGGGLEADESSLKVITTIRRRSSVSVSFTMGSPQYGHFLSSISMLPSKEPAIGDECEMARLSLRAEQCRIEGTWQEHAGLRKFRETPWNGACFLHLELTVVRAAHGMGKWSMAHRSCWKVHAGGLHHRHGMRYVFRVSS